MGKASVKQLILKEEMNSKRQEMEKLGHVVQIHVWRLP